MKNAYEDGYALILVIIVTTTVLILGIATTSIAFINYDMKKLNSISKRNFHIAESGVEEAELILYEYIQEIIIHSYRDIYKYEEMIKLKDNQREIEYFYTEKRDNMFKDIYINYVKGVVNILDDTNRYNLSLQDNYDFIVESVISTIELESEEKLILNIKSSYEGMGIMERIISEYIISIPEYEDYINSEELIEKIKWKNLKW